MGRTFLLGQSVKPLVSNNHGAQIFGRLTLSDQEGVTQNFCTYILHIKNVNWISSMCHMSSIQLAFWPPSSSVFMDFMGFVGPGSRSFLDGVTWKLLRSGVMDPPVLITGTGGHTLWHFFSFFFLMPIVPRSFVFFVEHGSGR